MRILCKDWISFGTLESMRDTPSRIPDRRRPAVGSESLQPKQRRDTPLHIMPIVGGTHHPFILVICHPYHCRTSEGVKMRTPESLMAGAKSNRFSVTSGDGGRQIDGRDIGPCPPPILGAEIRSLPWKRRAKAPRRLVGFCFST